MFHTLLKGCVIGVSIAAPIGPTGIFLINNSIRKGYQAGILAGIGATIVLGLYGAIAGFGLLLISQFLINHFVLIRVLGGLFLIYLGCRIVLSKPREVNFQAQSDRHWLSILATTFFITLMNPLVIVPFTAIFASLGSSAKHTAPMQATLLDLGIIIGSLIWWIGLSLFATLVIKKLNSKHAVLLWINRISGLVILGYGINAIINVLNNA